MKSPVETVSTPGVSATPRLKVGATSRILVIAEDEMPCEMVNAALSSHVASCNTREAMTMISESKPDMVLLDLEFVSMDPLVMIKMIHARFASLPILLMLTRADPLISARVLRAGAQGCLLKREIPDHLSEAVSAIAHGGKFVSEVIMQRILHNMTDKAGEAESTGVDLLSDRELVIFEQLGMGHPVRDIAEMLKLSVKTVNTHRANIKRKMHFTDVGQLNRCAQAWLKNGAGRAPRATAGH